jgi:hypothetical protein
MTAMKEPLRDVVLLLGLVASASGCGGVRTYPVEGTVVIKGTTTPARELAGYQVQFESEQPRTSAVGVVEADGTFRLGTKREGDGAVPGKHRVALTPPLETEGKPRPKNLLADRYRSFETSPLEVTIKPQANTVTLEVELKR